MLIKVRKNFVMHSIKNKRGCKNDTMSFLAVAEQGMANLCRQPYKLLNRTMDYTVK